MYRGIEAMEQSDEELLSLWSEANLDQILQLAFLLAESLAQVCVPRSEAK